VRRFVVPGIPFVVSFALSLSTAGAHVYWQDSGFFLVAVKELGVLYPPGFALYVLLCKAWTLMWWWVDFTYAVHLFSATCAALAAGTIAVAARDLLRTKGPIFHTVEDVSPLADWVGVSVGCLAASGYTFWAAAILAKVYAFYYLILSLLIWRMIRADESGKPRDFTWVAVLIGLAWQAHPSTTNAGLALILFVAFHRRVVGWKGIAWRTGLAALCGIGPIHLLPIMARHGSALTFGNPDTHISFVSYVFAGGFMTRPGAFGLDGGRVASVVRYGWEEFLGVGVLMILAGVWRLWQENRRLLIGLAAWVVPVLVVTVLFKLEGQHDFWMVAAWIPLWLVVAVGLSLAGKGREFAVLLALIGTIWAVIANRKDLDQRDYTMAETFGRYFLGAAGSDATLDLSSDDAQSTTVYLQRVKGEHPSTYLSGPAIDTMPPLPIRSPHVRSLRERPPPSSVDDFQFSLFSPEGALYREGPISEPPQDGWREPAVPEEVIKSYRRERGQFVEAHGGTIRVRSEPYEKRLLRLILLMRKNSARAWARTQPKIAEPLYDSILALDPWTREDADFLMLVAVVKVAMKKYPRAEELFKSALNAEPEPKKRAEAYYFLAALCGDRPEGAEWKAKALADPNLASELRAKLEGR
jgi:hypothetical protein